jgi:hypothetical protein
MEQRIMDFYKTGSQWIYGSLFSRIRINPGNFNMVQVFMTQTIAFCLVKDPTKVLKNCEIITEVHSNSIKATQGMKTIAPPRVCGKDHFPPFCQRSDNCLDPFREL